MSNKQEEMRNKLILKANSADIREQLEDDPTNPDLWYKMGTALSDEIDHEAGIDAFSQGLVYNPFNASLYFGRGRKYIGLGRYWRCISDTTMAIRIQPEMWNHWYYRAVAYNLNGNYAEATADFMQCYNMTDPEEHYPMVDWLFLCALDMNDKEKAREVLELIDDKVIPPAMDYAYRRRVMLYKKIVAPDEFIDVEHIKKNCLPLPNRVELEINTLTFGLFAYYTYTGDTEKANEVLLKIVKFEPSAAFGYIKGVAIARKRGLI